MKQRREVSNDIWAMKKKMDSYAPGGRQRQPEFDTLFNAEVRDPNSNHVGIDVNSLVSRVTANAGYFEDGTGEFRNLSLISRRAMQAWVDYDGVAMQVAVTMAPLGLPKPKRPLLRAVVDLSDVVRGAAYVGFSSSTGILFSRHFVLGWSFRSKVLEIVLPVASAALVLAAGIAIYALVRRRLKYDELHDDWEALFGSHRFSYKDLYHATNGFSPERLLGAGGFGSVYKGVLRKPDMEVAVKKMSHQSRKGMKEFIAEIVSMGRLRHRNLVQLLGYCRRKGELLLVYDYMPNGSLDKFLLYDHGDDAHTTHVVGTMGYLAPELGHTGKATPATDVFAFGAFLLEACFVFAIVSSYDGVSDHGLAFVFSPTTNFSAAKAGQYLGLLNATNGTASDHVLAVELDTIMNPEFRDINSNHVGVDVNSLISEQAQPAGYYDDAAGGALRELELNSRKPMQVWVDYDDNARKLNVTLAPVKVPKPKRPVLSTPVNLSSIMADKIYIGFSSATGVVATHHYVLGWSFSFDGPAPPLDFSKLPVLPRLGPKPRSKVLDVVLPLTTALLVAAVLSAVFLILWRRHRYAEVKEDWEDEFGPQRFVYKDLFHATDGFKDRNLLGVGGFGKVYKGLLSATNLEMSVKKVSHDSRQGVREFVAEVVSIGRGSSSQTTLYRCVCIWCVPPGGCLWEKANLLR
ncbi:hypothetical protein PR202_gb21387 [Eleusine coracana subsp. coracana]|uniref:non-specific serine/threonine protein kinase n=1 Tax=Eleusine coracana subsp. coracana TaxID=191504 RepID=A0AAV5FF24_ELECO|nr:hypothetical protein PR202_gb21387 [Eleusine coracana subsp. coracana]